MSELVGKKGRLTDVLSVILIFQYLILMVVNAYLPPVVPFPKAFWDNSFILCAIGATYHFTAVVVLLLKYVGSRYQIKQVNENGESKKIS